MILNSGKCPICSSEMKKAKNRLVKSCVNECYGLYYQQEELKVIFIFKDYWKINGELDLVTKLEIYRKIIYWKNNERYLMEILE